MDVVGALGVHACSFRDRQVSVPCVALCSTDSLRLFKASRSGYQHAPAFAQSIEPTFLSLQWKSPHVLNVSDNH